jgi:hypothetical protein
MFPISHLLVLSQESFLKSRVLSVLGLCGRGGG